MKKSWAFASKVVAFTVVVLSFGLLVGCGNPRVDGSTDETMKQSLEVVREALPAARHAEFDEAVKTLLFSGIDLKDIFSGGDAAAGEMKSNIRETFDGKSGEEIIASAEMVLADRRHKERLQAVDEIRELEQERQEAETARINLQKFEVTRSRFTQEEQEYTSRKKPIIEISVRNGTTQAVARAHFEGIVASPGRSVPWIKEAFSYEIAGGLEPGEEARWRLGPNMFSAWGKTSVPSDAILTVTVKRIDGADGEVLFSTLGFSDLDKKRLEELRANFRSE